MWTIIPDDSSQHVKTAINTWLTFGRDIGTIWSKIGEKTMNWVPDTLLEDIRSKDASTPRAADINPESLDNEPA